MSPSATALSLLLLVPASSPGSGRRRCVAQHALLFQKRQQKEEEKEEVPGAFEDQQRRGILRRMLLLSSSSTTSVTTATAATTTPLVLSSWNVQAMEHQQQVEGERLTVPLHYIPRLSAYVVYYRVGGERFGAILDTGSPFLVVPSYCNRRQYGCYDPDQSRPAIGLPPTTERFDNNEGQVEWRVAPFSFVNATGSMMGPREMVFGVLSESLMNGSGGVFFGLIRDTDDWIRPSFLSQTSVQAMEIDLRNHVACNDEDDTNENNSNCYYNNDDNDDQHDGRPQQQQKTLTLYTKSPLQGTTTDYIPLVRLLNQKYGDPVVHYTAKACDLQVNGHSVLAANNSDHPPMYVIFDTGVTGMVVSQQLFDQRYATARQNREKSLWGGTVQITFQSQKGRRVSLTAHKPVTTPLGVAKPWPKFNKAHLLVVGLAFLDGHKMVIDMEGQKLQLL